MTVMNFDLEDGLPPVSFDLKPADAERFAAFIAECHVALTAPTPPISDKDAERYQWLRKNIEKFGEEIQCVDDEDSNGYFCRYITPEECDAAIDAAMKEAK